MSEPTSQKGLVSLEFMFIQIISWVSVLGGHLVKKFVLNSNFTWLLRAAPVPPGSEEGQRPRALLTEHDTTQMGLFISKLFTPNYRVCPSHKFDPAREIKLAGFSTSKAYEISQKVSTTQLCEWEGQSTSDHVCPVLCVLVPGVSCDHLLPTAHSMSTRWEGEGHRV